DAARFLQIAPRNTVKDYEDRIARINALPVLIEQTIVLLEKGLATGITPPRITLRDVPQQVLEQTERDAAKNPLLEAFQEFPKDISENDRTRLKRLAVA